MPVASVLLHLGYGFFKASLSYPFRIGRGKEKFLKSYGAEGLVPVTPEHRELAARFERCLGCGLCELALPPSLPVAELAASSWRSPETWPALSTLLNDLASADLARAEALCPTAVPLRAMTFELRTMLLRWREMGGERSLLTTSEEVHSIIVPVDEAANDHHG